jgi:hypothetical protein
MPLYPMSPEARELLKAILTLLCNQPDQRLYENCSTVLAVCFGTALPQRLIAKE